MQLRSTEAQDFDAGATQIFQLILERTRYYQNAPISSVDLDVLAKMCFVLNCDIGDVLRYERPENEPSEF